MTIYNSLKERCLATFRNKERRADLYIEIIAISQKLEEDLNLSLPDQGREMMLNPNIPQVRKNQTDRVQLSLVGTLSLKNQIEFRIKQAKFYQKLSSRDR